MSNFTIINPSNPSQSYTFGKRGKRAGWVTAGLSDGSIKLPEGYLTAKEKLTKIDPDADPNAPKRTKTVNVEKAIDKLMKKLAHAKNVQSVAQRHLDEAKNHVANLQTVIDTLVQSAIEKAQNTLNKVQGVAVQIADEVSEEKEEIVSV